MDDKWFDLGKHSGTHAFLQWKGTDACMDFRCECGADVHFDGYFAHNLECMGCGVIWQMPMMLFPRKVVGDPHGPVTQLVDDGND